MCVWHHSREPTGTLQHCTRHLQSMISKIIRAGEIFPLSMPRAVSKWNQNAKHVWIAETSCLIAFEKGSGLVGRGRTLINLLQSNISQLWLNFLYWKPLGIVTSVYWVLLIYLLKVLTFGMYLLYKYSIGTHKILTFLSTVWIHASLWIKYRRALIIR